jgi:hypothetical protein
MLIVHAADQRNELEIMLLPGMKLAEFWKQIPLTFPSRPSRGLHQGTPETRPSPILRRVSRPSSAVFRLAPGRTGGG